MDIDAQIKLMFAKNNIDEKYMDLDFLKNELKTFQGNIQKLKRNDVSQKSVPIFSHIQIRRESTNDKEQ